MRASEFINEEITRKLTKSAKAAIRRGRVWPALDNSNPYHSYRFGVAMAPSPNKEHIDNIDGPTGSKLVTISYTDAEDEIIDCAARSFGITSQDVTSKNSEEMDTINKTSPVPQNSGRIIRKGK